MSIRSLFDAAIDAEPGPPSGLDVDRIVARGRRASRHRLLAVGGSGLAAAAAMTAFALLVGPVGGGLQVSSAGSPTVKPSRTRTPAPVQTASPTPSIGGPTPSVPPERYNSDHAASLSAAFEAALRAVAPPGTTFLDTRANDPESRPFAFGYNAQPYANQFTSGPDLRDAAGTGNVTLVIGKPVGSEGAGVGQFKQCPAEEPGTLPTQCTVRTGPHGERIVAMPRFWDQNGSKIARIDVTKPDGTGLVIEVRNWGLNDAADKISAKQRAQLPITVEQMTQVAVDPRLVIAW